MLNQPCIHMKCVLSDAYTIMHVEYICNLTTETMLTRRVSENMNKYVESCRAR